MSSLRFSFRRSLPPTSWALAFAMGGVACSESASDGPSSAGGSSAGGTVEYMNAGGSSTGGLGSGGQTSTGGQPAGSTCVANLVGGETCKPAIDVSLCELAQRDCRCDAAGFWTCSAKTGGTGGLDGAGGDIGAGGTGDTAGTGGAGGAGSGGTSSAAGGGESTFDYAATVENTGADCVIPELAEPGGLPTIEKMPDPFTNIEGARLMTKSEWRCRRQEIHKQAEKYIYGEKPSKPDVVSGTVTNTAVSVHVEAEGTSIDFSADIVLPSTGQAPYPAIINIGGKGGFGGISLGESRILDQGVAVIYYNHGELGREGAAEASRGLDNPGLFYDIYGGDHSAGLLMAWAWGASRMIDVLQESGGDIIDVGALGVTGCSRNGKGAFTVGVFDERIALTIPHETSTGGVPLYRMVDILNTERTDHNYYGLNWLSNDFEPFVYANNTSNAVKLPVDSHEMVAMIAPRGLLVLENPFETQMSAPAGHAATMGGLEVFKALGVEGHLSYHSSVSNTGHCSYKNEYTDLLIQNIGRFLKRENETAGEIIVGNNGDGGPANWITWETPTLQD